MTYLGWAAYYEGASDDAYFEQLIPRAMDDLVLRFGKRAADIPQQPAIKLTRGSVDDVASEACQAKDAFLLVFIHADTGGRGIERGLNNRSRSYCEAMRDLCHWPPNRCVSITPRHETEAWVLADPEAVMGALGYRGGAHSLGLPRNASEAENLSDPKATLTAAIAIARGRHRAVNPKTLLAAIAQRQTLANLRPSRSYTAFERALHEALVALGVCAFASDR